MGAFGFCGSCVYWVYFCCCSVGCFCQGLQVAGLSTVGAVGLSVCGECIGGRGIVVTD
jgi:hypothetical protein